MIFEELLKEKEEQLEMEMVEAFQAWVIDNMDKYIDSPLVEMRANTVKGDTETIILLKSPIRQIASDAKLEGLPNRFTKAKWIKEAFKEKGHIFKKQSTFKKDKYTVFNGFKLKGDYSHLEVISIDDLA